MTRRKKGLWNTEYLQDVNIKVMEETLTDKLARAKKDFPAGLQCTTPMGTSFTSTGAVVSDSKGNIFTSEWEFIYSATYDEWSTVNKDQPQSSGHGS